MKLLKQSTIWLPTWQGWVLSLAVFGGLFLVFLFNVHDFLAVTRRVEGADVLVVEAWVPEAVLRGATREFKAGRYRILVTSDLRATDAAAGHSEGERTSAAVSRIEALGVPRDRIVTCSVSAADEHRSHAMALAVRATLQQTGVMARGLNVVAPAAHARKTWLAYRRALQNVAPVGIISVLTDDYDPRRWWKTSQGAKWVIANGVGWLYEWLSGPRS